jgi:hypothetical protein
MPATCPDFAVELKGFEPPPLPAEIPPALQVRFISFQFVPARYLRFCFRVLTASRERFGHGNDQMSRPTGNSPQVIRGHTVAAARAVSEDNAEPPARDHN